MSANLAKRLIVSAIGIPVLVFIIYAGGIPLYILCLLVAILGSWELAAMLLSKKVVLGKRLATLLAVIMVSFFQFSSSSGTGFLVITIIFFMAAFLKMIETGVVDYASRLAIAFLTAIYPGFFISFAILIRRDFSEIGWVILLFTFVNTWLADTFAYSFGVLMGKRKLAPKVSPGKTWVGFVFAFPGGLLAALAAHYYLGSGSSLPVFITASLAATLAGQAGDLIESAIKRDCDVKDSSSLIPGHGGVLDRFDSLLFALPTVYFVFRFLALHS